MSGNNTNLMKIGIFGGTFNPIHHGHLRAAEEVREKLRMDRIVFIPSGTPPLKTKEIAAAHHRYEMTRLAIAQNSFFEVSDLECRQKGKSYTVKTLEILQQANPDAALYFILGIDAFLDIPNWWQPERLTAAAHFIVISRPEFRFADLLGSPYLTTGKQALRRFDRLDAGIGTVKLKSRKEAFLVRTIPMGISSTEIRMLIRHGKSIKYLLPPEVQSYIIINKLYSNLRMRVKG
ncbi:MAG: nicotinate-nucleotide adenylyltransferase [Nitrospirota bacterium]